MIKQFARPLLAACLAAFLAFGSITPASAQQQEKPAAPAPALASASVQPFSLGVARHDFSKGPGWFPNIVKPYKPVRIEGPGLANSPKLETMIHDAKLELGLQDAIELALQNNLDIAVQRYNPWIADTDILRTMGGGAGRGLSGTGTASTLGNIPTLNFDPTLTTSISFDDRKIPVNNPLTSGAGTGTSAAASLTIHTSTFNTQYSQGFHTGTGFFVAWDNTRSSSSSAFNLFNPSVNSSLFVGFSQQLLNGFGLLPNTRNIRIARNNRRIADWQFTQQAITSITNTINAYWELVFARENVKVQQQATAVAEKLYNDNKKQLEIGTMAPLDVTRAESELATDRQNLIVAQTVQLQQQQVLKNLISRDPLASNFVNVEVVPTDLPTTPAATEGSNFEDAVREALTKRPDLQQEAINLQNSRIDVAATRNALLPTAQLVAQYGTVGLAGNQPILGTPTTALGTQLVDGSGNLVNVFIPVTTVPVTGTAKDGLGGALSNVFHNNFPDYNLSLSLTVPIRNRQAQADNRRAILTQRQLEAQMQALKNTALLDVRNTYIALEQNRARVEAAAKARELQQQTFEAEQKKYQLGASTVYLVIQTQRDLITAQGNELRALADLVESKANHDRAVGRTLEVNRVTIAGAEKGQVDRDTLIPGTLNGQVVGVEALYKELEKSSK